jgi:hypothetical protein
MSRIVVKIGKIRYIPTIERIGLNRHETDTAVASTPPETTQRRFDRTATT